MLDAMQVFVDVIELRSFSRAALKNYLTQSAVSQKIQKLEETVGQPLILRGRGRLRPTEAGQVFFGAAKEILDRYARVREEIAGLDATVAGQVRIGTIPSVGLHELPEYLKTFLKTYPAVGLQLEYRKAQAIYAGVVDFTLDVGIVAYPVRHPQIHTIAFRHDQLILIAPPNHPLAAKRSIDIGSLDKMPFIAFESHTPTRRAVDRLLEQANVEVQMVHEFDNVEMIKRAVEIGAGVSIVPRATVGHEIDCGTLVQRPLHGHVWERPLAIIHRKGARPNIATQKLIELLTAKPTA